MPIRFLADENFTRKITDGLQRRIANLDLVKVQEAGLTAADDPSVLSWAAAHNLITLSHDISTMPDYALQRIEQGLEMPGLIIARDRLPISEVIDELVLIHEAGRSEDFDNKVLYLPM